MLARLAEALREACFIHAGKFIVTFLTVLGQIL